MNGIVRVLAAASLSLWLGSAFAQGKGVERLYILNCGEGVAGDISRWSPGVNVGKPMDFVDTCYLIKHAQLWINHDAAQRDGQKLAPAYYD